MSDRPPTQRSQGQLAYWLGLMISSAICWADSESALWVVVFVVSSIMLSAVVGRT